jgi:hypothetical protein
MATQINNTMAEIQATKNIVLLLITFFLKNVATSSTIEEKIIIQEEA